MSNLNNISSLKENAYGTPLDSLQPLSHDNYAPASITESVKRVFLGVANLPGSPLQGSVKRQKTTHVDQSPILLGLLRGRSTPSTEDLLSPSPVVSDLIVPESILPEDLLSLSPFVSDLIVPESILPMEKFSLGLSLDASSNPFTLVKNGNIEALEKLLSQKDPSFIEKIVNQTNKKGDTLVGLAAVNGDLSMVIFLLGRRGININLKDRSGYTPLMHAAIRGYREIVKAFLSVKGADIYLQDNEGNTAFMLAAREGYTEIIQDFLETGRLDVNFKNKSDSDNDYTMLMLAAREGRRETAQFLLRVRSRNVNLQKQDGMTALMLAARNGWREIVEDFLKEDDINVSLLDAEQDVAAIEIAAMEGFSEIVQDLIGTVEGGVNFQFVGGNTLLMHAATGGNGRETNIRERVETIRVILGIEGIDVNLKNEEHETALDSAVWTGHKEVILELLEDPRNSIENLLRCLETLVSENCLDPLLIKKVVEKIRLKLVLD